jgi:hypothetical protein
VITIELFQTTPVLDDALGLRWMESQHPQLDFEKVQQSRRPQNRFPERISGLCSPLTIEVPTESDASFCHIVLPNLSAGSIASMGLQTPGYRCV